MENKEYQHLALISEADGHGYTMKERFNPVVARMMHAHLGLSSEVGEIGDTLKKYIAYGQKMDVENLIEEAGDVLWYVSLLLDAVGSNISEAMQRNIDKLKKRYPEGFSEQHAKMRLDKQEDLPEDIIEP